MGVAPSRGSGGWAPLELHVQWDTVLISGESWSRPSTNSILIIYINVTLHTVMMVAMVLMNNVSCFSLTDNCQGVCLFHNLVPTPPGTTTSTTQIKTSTAYHHTNVSGQIIYGYKPKGKYSDLKNQMTFLVISIVFFLSVVKKMSHCRK